MAALGSKLVLFGGSNGNTTSFLADTWTWDGTGWSKLTPSTSPSDRHLHAMATRAGKEIVLFGGASYAATRFDDTWIWNGATWSKATPANAPEARFLHAMVSWP